MHLGEYGQAYFAVEQVLGEGGWHVTGRHGLLVQRLLLRCYRACISKLVIACWPHVILSHWYSPVCRVLAHCLTDDVCTQHSVSMARC